MKTFLPVKNDGTPSIRGIQRGHATRFLQTKHGRSKQTLISLALLLALMIGVSGYGWGQPWTYDFGTGTGSYNTASGSSTTFFSSTPTNGGTYRIRCASTGNQGSGFILANAGTSLGTGTELQINASITASTNKFGVYDWTSPSTVAYMKCKFRTTSSGNGALNISLGVNNLVTDNNGYTSQYNNSVASLTITYASGAISSVIRRISGSNTTILSSGFSKDTDQLVEIYANNGTGSVNYTKSGSNTLATKTWDLWVDGTKVVSNAATAGTLAVSTNLSGFGFFGESSTSNAAFIYIDDLEYSNSLPSAAPEINIKQGTTDIASGGTYAFGNQTSGTSSTVTTFTIENTGTAVLNLTGTPKVAISGTNASEFTIDEISTTATVAASNSTTFTITFSPTSPGAKTAAISIANDDGNENPYLINLTGTGTVSSASDIVEKSGYTYPTNITYASYQATDITGGSSDIEIAQFTIRDGGGTADADNLTTTLNQVVFTVSNSANIRKMALYEGAIEVGTEQAGAGTVTFSGLSLTASDGGSKDFSVRVSFKSSVTDNQNIQLTISATTSAATTGSAFAASDAGGAFTSVAGDNNRIEVSTTAIIFDQDVSDVEQGVVMTPSPGVRAIDDNVNYDLDNGTDVTLTVTTGSVSFDPTATTTVACSSGLATFSNLKFNSSGTGNKLTATQSSFTDESASFDVTSSVPEINIKVISTNYLTGSTYAFGNQVSGTSSSVITFTIENLGTAALNLTGTPNIVAISGTNASEFTIDETSTVTPVAVSGSTTFTITFSPASQGSKTAQISIANNDVTGSEDPYIIYLTGSGTVSNSSDIANTSGYIYTSNVDYASYQAASSLATGNSIGVNGLTIQDGGGSADADNSGTTLTDISFTTGGSTAIRTAALFDGTTNVAEVAVNGATTISFSGLSLIAADDGTKDFELRVTYREAVIDNQQIIFTVSSATAAATGSGFASANAGGALSSSSGDINRIEVNATKFNFSTQPSNTTVNTNFSAGVEALDANNNRDLDATTIVTLSASAGTLSSLTGLTQNLVTGEYSWADLQNNTAGTGITLSATGTLTTAISAPFNILAAQPATLASSIVFSNVAVNSMTVSWTNGDGENRIVVARLSSTTIAGPADGTDYTSNSPDITDILNATTGTGNIVIFNGAGSNVTVTGLSTATSYTFDIYEYNGSGQTTNYSGNFSGTKSTLAAEPTTQATNVTFTNVSSTSFKINWTLGNGINSLVLVKDGSAVDADPVDGTSYTASQTFGSGTQIGTGNFVVYRATLSTVTITGLTDGHTYYVAVYSYNGTLGSGLENYLITSPATGSQLASMPTYYSQGSGDPATLTNWNTNPAGGGSSPANFTTDPAIFVIQNGHNMTTTATWSVGNTGSKLQIENGGTLTANNAITIVTGTTFQIDNGGTYIHNNSGAFGSTIFNGNENFAAASNIEIKNYNTTGPSGVAFGNLVINNTVDATGSLQFGGNITTINGNFTLQNLYTGREVRLSASTTLNLVIAGNFTVQNGTLDFASGAGSSTSRAVSIGGNYDQSGGTVKCTGSSNPVIITFTGSNKSFTRSAGTLTNTNIYWVVNSGASLSLINDLPVASSRSMNINGTADCGSTSVVSGAGAFTLASGATLITAHTSGIDGSITVTGTKTLSTGANYVFNGSSALVTGALLPATVNDLTVDNSAGVSLSGNTTVSGVLNLTNGLLTTGTYTVTAAGTITGASSSSYIDGRLAQNFSIPGSKTFPIGKGGNYRPLSIDYTSLDAQSTVTAEQTEGTLPGTLPSGISLFNTRYWTVSQTGATNYTYTITLDGNGFSPSYPVKMLKGDAGTIVAYNVTTPNYTNAAAFTSFSDFGLGEEFYSTTTTADNKAVCEGETSVNLTATVSPDPGGGTVQFKIDGDNVGSPVAVLTGGTASYTYNPSALGSGGHTIGADFSGVGIYGSSSGSGTLTVNPILAVSVFIEAGANPACTGAEVIFTATPTNGGTPSYQWKLNDGNVGTNSSTYSYTPSDGDKIKVVMTSTETCQTGSPATSGEITMALLPLPAAPAAGNVTATYNGLPHAGTATPPSGSTVVWYNASSGGSVISAPSGTNVGTYTAWAESVDDVTGCSSASRTEVTVTITAAISGLKVMLQGPYNGTTHEMETTLNAAGKVPLDQPYNTAPWSYTGTESVTTMPADAVDWVLVELRTTPSGAAYAKKATLLFKNGSVYPDFTSLDPEEEYHIVVWHRNHMPVMSKDPVPVATTIYDLTVIDNLYGTNPAILLEGTTYGMIAGDVTKNGKLSYSGAGNDRGPIIAKIISLGGTTLISTFTDDYWFENTNMDNVLSYLPDPNDRGIIIANLNTLVSPSLNSIYTSVVPGATGGKDAWKNDGPFDIQLAEFAPSITINLITNETIENGLVDNIQFTLAWKAGDTEIAELLSSFTSDFMLAPQGEAYTVNGVMHQVYASVTPVGLPEEFNEGDQVTVLSFDNSTGQTVTGRLWIADDDFTAENNAMYYVSVWGNDFTGMIQSIATGLNEIPAAGSVSIYPNPVVNGMVNIAINLEGSQDVTITLTDLQGKTISYEEINASAGLSIHPYDLKGVGKGVYFIRISGDNLNIIEKLVIQSIKL